jgi:tRNA(adenine34) deaminase
MTAKNEKWMQLAIEEAKEAGRKDEVPVGAALVSEDDHIISVGHNQVLTLCDPTAHAEIIAVREAAKKLGNYRLLNTALYVTVEPCAMCMGALIHARVKKIVFGVMDEKWGCAGSMHNFAEDRRFNHQPEIVGGVLEPICRELMQAFFREKRRAPATGFHRRADHLT